MDFWDLAKLLFRRWYFSLPLVLLVALGTTLIAQNTKPDYIATTHVQLIPPVLAPPKPGQEDKVPQNPWVDLGLQTLTEAATQEIQGKGAVDGLKATGLSDSFTITPDEFSPLVTIEAVGNSTSQATATVDQLASLFSLRVKQLQTDQAVKPAVLIKSLRLTNGDKVKKSATKVVRAAVVVGAVGLLLTAATTIGLDALLRRRRRQPQFDGGASLDALPAMTALNGAPITVSVNLTSGKHSNHEINGGSLADSGLRNDSRASAGGLPVLDVEYRPVETPKVERDMALPSSSYDSAAYDDTVGADHMSNDPDDETIVLPLSHGSWATRDGGKRH